ncbi:hypothetical protein RR48_12623 [Papilio machaon]|uniref:Uncharacterized protein n=1 Tax=Papilio machaon TaxID=76193 RepID=A0A194RNM7_PAPMA|nr:hypothetical protein RR48_12623 [Papilio machaon]
MLLRPKRRHKNPCVVGTTATYGQYLPLDESWLVTSLAASVEELDELESTVSAESAVSAVSTVSAVSAVSMVCWERAVPGVSLVTPRSVVGYQRCSSRPFRGCRSVWSDGRLRLKKPH